MDNGHCKELLHAFRESMNRLLTEKNFSETDSLTAAKDFLTEGSWSTAPTILDAIDRLKTCLKHHRSQMHPEIKQIFQACMRTMLYYYPIWHIIKLEGNQNERLLALKPDALEIWETTLFYYNCQQTVPASLHMVQTGCNGMASVPTPKVNPFKSFKKSQKTGN